MEQKTKFWVGILWESSMIENWEDKADLLIQFPYCYCKHDKDIDGHGDPKAVHTHIMIAYSNTTTENHIRNIFNRLSKPGQQCCNKVYPIGRLKYVYDYLIHDTDQARKERKHPYEKEERIERLGFNIDLLQDEAVTDRYEAIIELSNAIIEKKITNYANLFEMIMQEYDLSYLQLLISYSGHFERVVKGVWQGLQAEKNNGKW